ncbi:phosphoenolpyruvate--protein phosphotransferase [Sphingomonas sp. PB4P5]|uniref:phosphoenolpyruvate--protein phosphotransferase n=1 Tax=Parasphingomonas puruogangriensis TaxID=3096155 RepID=UPI002FCA8B8A
MIVLHAPMAGWAMPLDAVPDPVFAERMMGDGFAIDPLDGTIRAPCDATVIAVAPTRHSVTLRLANGAELLIHVGLETVALAGAGFTAEVRDGDVVVLGQPLLEVDLDAVALRAKSLVTPITVMNEGFALRPLELGRRVASGDMLAEIEARADCAPPPPQSSPRTCAAVHLDATTTPADSAAPWPPEQVRGDEGVAHDTARISLRVPLANGVHARPAARIVATLKPFAAEVTITAHGKPTNARSIVALLAAGIAHNDEIEIVAHGPDARAAVTAVATLIEHGIEETAQAAATPQATASLDGLVLGVRAAPGLAIGAVFQWRATDIQVAEHAADVATETAHLAAARKALLAITPHGDIAAAHHALLDDPELLAAAGRYIADGKSAAFAWRATTTDHAAAILATRDPLLIERIADLKDIERQLIARLTGTEASLPTPPRGAIVIADEILPSHFAILSSAGIAGICTAYGGPTAHAAILAAAAGIPMIVAAGADVLDLTDASPVILDADKGTLNPSPDVGTLAMTTKRMARRRDRITTDTAAAHDDCVMADGTRIEIFANLASPTEATHAVALGAEGCGLLRSEFLFLDRDTAPSEDEQCAAYAAVAAGLGGRPLIVRTLDIGGDKPVAYLPFPHEDNPALGARGIRFSLARPDLLATQVRAILRGVPAAQCRIMLPMIVDAGELAAARTILDEARVALGIVAPVPLGVMIETPAAALLAESIARDADFLSIGSNDLTQYALAADRGNPAVAAMVDALHPAVLHLIARAADGARAHRRWLGICGGIASDPRAAPILIGLGITELSATSAAIPALKAVVRRHDLPACQALAARALACATAADVRALLETV